MTSETLASKSGTGQYGSTWESRLVKRGDKHYLVHDHFCGMDSLEGGAYRPFVYSVPSERVEEVKGLYDTADEFIDPARPELGNDWCYLTQHVLPTLESYGRASHLSWAKSL